MSRYSFIFVNIFSLSFPIISILCLLLLAFFTNYQAAFHGDSPKFRVYFCIISTISKHSFPPFSNFQFLFAFINIVVRCVVRTFIYWSVSSLLFFFNAQFFLTFCPVFCRVNFVCFQGFSGIFLPDFTQSHGQSQIRYFLQKLGGVGEVHSFLFQHNLLRPFSKFISCQWLFIKLSSNADLFAQFQFSVSFLSVFDAVMWFKVIFSKCHVPLFLFLSSYPHFREFYS